MPLNLSATDQQIPKTDPHAPVALVIGSGFGGLAAAVRMCAKGWRVQVLEKLNEPGGRARVHHVDGYIFDAGPTIVTVPFLLEELWNLAGRKLDSDVELRLLDPFYRIRFDDGDHFDYSGDPERMLNEVLRIDPTAGLGYAAFMAEVEALRAELAEAAEFTPGRPVAAALAAVRRHIAFMSADRAMDGEVQRMVDLVEHGELLMAARAAQ